MIDNKWEEYTVHCVDCHTTVGLAMIAHRVKGKMIGWLFVCRACWPTMSETISPERSETEDTLASSGTIGTIGIRGACVSHHPGSDSQRQDA